MQQGHQRPHDLLGLLARPPLVDAGAWPVHEQGVEVRAVGDLPAALAAHGHHEHVGERVGVPDDGARGHAQGADDGDLVDVRQGPGDGLEVQQPRDVRQGHAQGLAAPHLPHMAHGRGGLLRGHAAVEPRVDLAPQLDRAPGVELPVVAHPGHGLGRVLEQVPHEPGAGQDQAQPPGGVRGVAEHPQIPGRAAERLGEPAEGEQAAVGVGAPREPAEHGRQQLPLDRGPARDALREGLDVPQGALRVAVAQRRQAVADGLRGQPHVLGGQGGRRRQQRPVEHGLVETAHGAAHARELGLEVLAGGGAPVGGAAHRPGDDAAGLLLDRHQVGAPQVHELDAVLEGAQPPVVLVERPRVSRGDVGGGVQRPHRVERAAHPQRLVRTAVHELEQLGRELDVAQAAGPELDLPLALRGGEGVQDPGAHGPDGLDEPVARGGLPHPGPDFRDVALAELWRARDGAGLEQGLELPAVGPAAVVLGVGLHGAAQGAVLALGTQVGVDFPQSRLGGRALDHAADARGQLGRERGGARPVRDLGVGVRAVRGLADGVGEHDVHV